MVDPVGNCKLKLTGAARRSLAEESKSGQSRRSEADSHGFHVEGDATDIRLYLETPVSTRNLSIRRSRRAGPLGTAIPRYPFDIFTPSIRAATRAFVSRFI